MKNRYVSVDALLALQFPLDGDCERPFPVISVNDMMNLPFIEVEDAKCVEQEEFCTEHDCFNNVNLICLSTAANRDSSKGRQCPCYTPD